MDADKKKQLKSNYKTKPVIGAVYTIECSRDPRRIIRSTTDISGIKNRFQFAVATKSCPDPAVSKEWTKYGTEAFNLIVLEELEKKADQTAKEFADDIKTLYELWIEKLTIE